jgi:multicomponent Na+:H+ antiporter subunit E
VSVLAVHLLLAFGWAAVNGSFSLLSLVVGFFVGGIVLWLVRPLYGPTRYFSNAVDTARLAGFFLWELVVSCLQVAHDVLTPTHHSRPGVIALPLDATTAVEITAVANLITLTPGTMTLDVSEDRRTLWVHAMFVDDPDELRAALKHGMESRVLEVTRGW